MHRKILKWVIISQQEYEKLVECEKAFKILCNMSVNLIDICIDLLKRL